ncbi:MAG TPA: hypothetical protein VF131_01950 [Blastocatellia bacterium]|nr:hypothetical protein [Blastocatellia bacterium]
MTKELLKRVKKIEQSPAVIKAAERQRELREWEDFVSYHMDDLKHYIVIREYEGCSDSREVVADDYIEYAITVVWRLSKLHPINIGEFWPDEIAEPIRFEVYRELMLRWYGINRTPEEEADAMRIGEQLLDDLESGLPREQSEAAALYEQSYARHPRLNYIYKNLPEIKPEGWEWRL